MNNKQVICNLNNNKKHIGEYFEVKLFLNKYFLFHNINNQIKLIISNDLNFNNKPNKIIISNAPGGCFTTIISKNIIYLLVGSHVSNKEKNEIQIPDLVWPKEKRTILNWNITRQDRKNGMYLLKSNDGINWVQCSDKPVLHSYIESPSCKLGELCFDTHPCLIYWKNEYYFYGRLNSSLDERRIFIRKSKDLISWSLPERIIITNENKGIYKNNYYHFVVFEKDNMLYAFTPYFEACGTEARKCKNGKTLLLESQDGINWKIIKSYLHHEGKYKDRVNSVLENKVFYRENCTMTNQNLISYNFTIS